MESKYLEYKDEIISLFEDGNGYSHIAQFLIDKYYLNVSKQSLRHRIRDIIQYFIADKDIIEYNVRLSKKQQKYQDLNRIKNKAFREHSRIENALVVYNDELIKLLKSEGLKTPIKHHKVIMILRLLRKDFKSLLTI